MTSILSAQQPILDRPARSGLIRSLARFDGPPEAFAQELVAGLAALTGARHAALLRMDSGGQIDLVAAWPALATGETPAWLAQAADLFQPGAPPEPRTFGPEPGHVLAVVPLESRAGGGAHLCVAVLLPLGEGGARPEGALSSVPLIDAAIELYESRSAQTPAARNGARLERAIRSAEAVNGQASAPGAAFAFVNHVAAAWGCERAAIGISRGAAIRLAAISHSDRFLRSTRPVQDLEAAMEECLDQDTEVIVPAPAGGDVVTRQHEAYASAHGCGRLLSLPLRHAGKTLGVLTVERPAERPLADEDIAALRVACDLAAPRLLDLAQRDRWLGARAAAAARESAARLLGAEHTWAKLLAIGLLGLVAFAALVKGPYTAGASCVLRSTVRRVVPAPFDGYIESVAARPGDRVRAGTAVLATLQTAELDLELAELRARESAAATQAAMARAEGKIAEAQVAEAARAEATARASVVEHRLGLAVLRAPIDGVVVVGELDQRIGGPVRIGETLFEIASLNDLRADLEVAEDQVSEVRVGQTGSLATAARPSEPVRFSVEAVDPLGEEVAGRAVFRVRAALADPPEWLRPGMEGVARIDLGRRSYAFIWTREVVNWLRLRLWM